MRRIAPYIVRNLIQCSCEIGRQISWVNYVISEGVESRSVVECVDVIAFSLTVAQPNG